MSKQPPPRIRLNESPSSTKQGPIKAVKAFSLKKSNAQSTAETSPVVDSNKLWTRYSPDSRFSPERKSFTAGTAQHTRSSSSHKEKTIGSRQSPLPGKLRPNSADAVIPSYLTGQWPKDINSQSHCQSHAVYMCDKSAQTVEFDNKTARKKGHRRSASFEQGDQLQLQYIKQHLQKSKEGSKYPDGKQHTSPIPGNHLAFSMTVSPVLCLQHTKAAFNSARHIARHNVNRYQRNSVEGLNMEIEKLVSSIAASTLSAKDDDADVFIYEIPDGHRAPGPEFTCVSSTHSVDTQTPSYLDCTVTTSLTTISRSASISPATTPRPGSVDIYLTSRSESTDNKFNKGDRESCLEPTDHLSSPKFQKSCPFVREPPDGCEKVTVVEESRRPKIKEQLHFSPVKPNKFVFKQSQGSAFCPLKKAYDFPLSCTGSSSPVLTTSIDE